MAILSLSLLGHFQAFIDERPLTHFRTNKVQALLIYLATESAIPHQREALMTLLWPGLPHQSARINLRQILYQLRKTIPELGLISEEGTASFLLSERQSVQVNPNVTVNLDIEKFSRLIHESQIHNHLNIQSCSDCQTRLERAVAYYKGVFLADFFLADSNLFENWVQAKRETFQRQMIDALDNLTMLHMKPGSYAQAQTYARRQLEIDNLNERATRQLMEALARNGQRSEALVVYKSCQHRLNHELGMAPTVKTTQLYEQILEDGIGQAGFHTPKVRGYDLLEEIGMGAFGVVHRAYQHVIGREVAVKIIHPQYANQPNFIRNFEAEAQTIARLEHPHIVPLYDFWREPDGAYLVMRWLRGGSLKTSLEGGPWSLATAVSLINQITAALHVTHRQGVIHRDIKPANILLDEEGNAYLSDFGIAKDLKTAAWQASTIDLKEPLAYISPEQILNEEITPLTDQYSLGIVLYELITGQRPFTQIPFLDRIQKQIVETLPMVSDQFSDFPPVIDAVIQKATANKPTNRYSDILAFATAFRDATMTGDKATKPYFISESEVDIPNPYKGLRAFQEADADYFFGRDELVNQLVDHLTQNRFLAVVGPSGSGKSSVVKAGLLPALRQGKAPGSENWFVAEMTPGAYPLEELEAALLHNAVNPPPSLLEPLQKDERGLSRTLKRILPFDQEAAGPSQLLLVIDQFEELFTLVTDDSRRHHFLQNLFAAINEPHSRLRIIITLRADFYDRPLQLPELGELIRQHTAIVLPLTATELDQAIVGPAACVGAHLEAGLVKVMMTDVANQPGALPLLQYALTELFDRRIGQIMTQSAYQEIGGVLGALGRRAEEIYQNSDGPDQETTHQLFLRLLTLGEGSEDTRRRVLLSELEQLDSNPIENRQSSIVNRYGRYRLLTFDRDPNTREPTVEVAHEALLREWPRLSRWLDESRDDIRQQRLLASSAAEWQQANQDPGFLLRGSRLLQFEDWSAHANLALTQDEQAFLTASLHAQQVRQAAEETRRQRELEIAHKLAETEGNRAAEQTRAARRLRRRAFFLVGALVVAAVLAVAAFVNGTRATQNAAKAQANLVLAETRQAEAEKEAAARSTAEAAAIAEREATLLQADLATSRELSLAALTNLDADPELAILLALQALNTTYTKEAEEALHQGMQASRIITTLSGHTAEVSGAIYSPDGSHIATVGNDSTVRVWDAATGQLLHTLPYEGIEYISATLLFDESGSEVAMVAVGDNFESVILHTWNINSGELLDQYELPILLENFSLILSPDWKRIVAGHENGTAELWDVEAAKILRTYTGHEDVVNGLAISSDGSRLAISSYNGQVNIWDIESSLEDADNQAIISFETPNEGQLRTVFFSNDNDNLTLGFRGEGIELELWNLADINQPQFTSTGHVNTIFDVAFHPKSSIFATGSSDGTAKVWDMLSGEELFTLSGHKGFVNRIDFSPDGAHLVTSGNDGTARIWNVQPQAGGELFTLNGGANAFDLKISPDEQIIAMGTYNGPASIWDAATGKHLFTLPGTPDTASFRVAFNPDGSRVATVGEDGIIRIWDAETGKVVLAFTGHTEGVSGGFFQGTLDVSYSPDGSRLATAGADGLAKVWDVETGAELLVLAGGTLGLHSLAYSPDGRYIATSSDSPDTMVRVWDAFNGAEIYSLGPNPNRAWGLAFSPDSNLLAAGGSGGYITVWDLTSGEVLINMTGQSSTIGTVAFTPDGQRLISGSSESASIWDITSGTELLNLAPDPSWDVALSHDGQRLYTVTGQPTPGVRVYAVPLEDAVILAQSRVTRSLTITECRQYLHVEECPTNR